MNVLFAVEEATPIYKIGGLGDVGGALPKALVELGIDVRIALPFHPEINLDPSLLVNVASFSIDYDRHTLPVNVFLSYLPGTSIPVYLFQEKTYLSEHTDASDNHADKFAVFSLAVSAWVAFYAPFWQPHVIHCHDWHTALIPVILKHLFHKSYKSILTIHNLAYQGVTTTPVAARLGLPAEACKIISWDQADGNLNILLEGLLHVDMITTVSPTYAKEILTDEYGEHITDILASRKDQIVGIVNGIDDQEYNPATDRWLDPTYTLDTWKIGRQQNRENLQRELQLPVEPNSLLIGFVGRVDPYQKGIGIIIQALQQKRLPGQNCEFVFLGTGDVNLESQLHQAAANNPFVRIITRFDEPLARRVYAASHIMVIPSRFEPCGLVQLIAMRYGALPVARATGGLKDTITHGKNGFLFDTFSTDAFVRSLQEAIDKIGKEELYIDMVNNAMSQEISWHTSAKNYAMLYEAVVTG